MRIEAKHILFDVEAHGAGDGIGNHQRRRGQESLLGIGMDAAIEIAIATEHRRDIQVAFDDFLLDGRIQRAAHAIAGGAGKADDAEAELFQFRQQIRLFKVQLHGARAGSQRGLHPGLAPKSACVGVARQQTGGNHVARVGGVGAGGDRGNDHGAIRNQAPGFLVPGRKQFGLVGNTALLQGAYRQAPMRIARSGQIAHHRGKVEMQAAFVLRLGQIRCPEAAGPGVVADQRHLFFAASGQSEVVQRVVIDEEHRRGGTVFRRHVGNGGAIANGQCRRTFAMELQIRADHFFLAQEFGEGQHHVGGGDSGCRFAGKLHRNDVGQAHP